MVPPQLRDDQRQRSVDLGFNVTTQEERYERVWNEKYERLKAFRREHGHCRVPYQYEKDPQLANWVSYQRQMWKKNRLAGHRVQKLDAITFVWVQKMQRKNKDLSREDETWLQFYEKLTKFKVEHGHCSVPINWSVDKKLGRWVKRQRVTHNWIGDLRHDRKELLDEIGFIWKPEKAEVMQSVVQPKWNVKLDLLKAYKEDHGNVKVPKRFKKGGLGLWLQRQRSLARHGRLDSARAEDLRRLGVTWEKEIHKKSNKSLKRPSGNAEAIEQGAEAKPRLKKKRMIEDSDSDEEYEFQW